MNGAPVIECRHLSHTFMVKKGRWARRPLLALDDVDLKVHRGEVLAIVGESGCGKSTLARIVLGLLTPTSGAVLLDGAPVDQMDHRQRARRIQPVFQDPYSSLNPRKTVAQSVALPLLLHSSTSARERSGRVGTLLEACGLPQRLWNAYPGQLSGGQRQRVAIARALAINPGVLVCDEPTSALDVSVQAQVINLLQDLKATLGLTYLFISHNLAVVEHLADRIAVMYLGRVVELGKARDVFDNPRHPYTRVLLRSALTVEPGAGLPYAGIRGSFPDPLDPPIGCHFHPRCPDGHGDCRTRRPAAVTDASGNTVECRLYPEPVPGSSP